MQYFEDFAVGQRFSSGRRRVEAAEITAFAAEYDPQPFHLDDVAGQASVFGGMAASGWHTAAMTMRLLVPSAFQPAGGIVGFGGELAWLKPVRPGDELCVESEIIATRPSQSRPGQGLVTVRVTTLNQHGETVQTFTPTLLVDRRPR
ncbi:MAG: MaoC family dehydratase [Alphaproteobacteria bacterium]|nr:MaoC family dehydratase [Alphaproteobacteria bacterium]MBV9552730.1 MaoC family dehydratase [Alphaproteobacteria bacterium]